MSNLNGFNANEVEPGVGFEPIPMGLYPSMITKSELRPTKSGSGHYLELTFEITAGAYTGRNAWARLNIDNSNPTAVKLAKAELSAICRAVNVMTPRDSSQLHNIPLIIKLGHKTRTGSDEIMNVIRAYHSGDELEPAETPSETTGFDPDSVG